MQTAVQESLPQQPVQVGNVLQEGRIRPGKMWGELAGGPHSGRDQGPVHHLALDCLFCFYKRINKNNDTKFIYT